jgi:hypothetical protein
MAIKINVSAKDQEAINHVLEKVGYRATRRKFHCTFGFIEAMIPHEEAPPFGQAVVAELQEFLHSSPLLYEVEKAMRFHHVLAFMPTAQALNHLKQMNRWLFKRVHELSEHRWGLNTQTIPENYTPHMTLGHLRRPDHRLQKIDTFAHTHPRYHLTQAAYVVFG